MDGKDYFQKLFVYLYMCKDYIQKDVTICPPVRDRRIVTCESLLDLTTKMIRDLEGE